MCVCVCVCVRRRESPCCLSPDQHSQLHRCGTHPCRAHELKNASTRERHNSKLGQLWTSYNSLMHSCVLPTIASQSLTAPSPCTCNTCNKELTVKHTQLTGTNIIAHLCTAAYRYRHNCAPVYSSLPVQTQLFTCVLLGVPPEVHIDVVHTRVVPRYPGVIKAMPSRDQRQLVRDIRVHAALVNRHYMISEVIEAVLSRDQHQLIRDIRVNTTTGLTSI